MSKSAKNLIIVLAIVLTAFVGYYLFTQEASLVLRTTESDRQLEQLLRTAEEFTARQQILNSVTLNTEIFESPSFNSLQGFSPDPLEFGVRRPDPFLPVRSEQAGGVESSE